MNTVLTPSAPRIPALERLHFEIVKGCQLRCLGCPNSTLQPKVQRIDVGDFDRCLRNIDVDFILYLRLFNFGEPLLHHDLPGILSRIPAQRWKTRVVEISTNAQFADWPALEEALRTRVLTQIAVSCDGDGTPEEYERLRPPSRWEKLLEFLGRMRELRDRYCPELRLVTRTICEDPTAQARWRALMEPRGWSPEFRGWMYLPESKENMLDRDLDVPARICSFQAVHHRLYVDWDGTVVPCCVHPRAGVLGNLKEATFHQITFGHARRSFLRQLHTDRAAMQICNRCEF
ncbi:radical SAM/SPASM domain-containing protein [Azospirillum sp. ST 5-10]|uniref:radical SAM/SPASM domain-containing protein n=1 Tax=unclassified Azospirillum TaxID=2630922 RepID=UPI003F4A32BF